MKKMAPLWLLLLVACNNNSSASLNTQGEATEIKVGKCLQNDENGVSLCFNSVITDSRCPDTADCFWEGDAEVEFTLSAPAGTADFTLHSHSEFRTDTVLLGYHIAMMQLLPNPPSVENVNDYIAEVTVTED